MSYVDTQSNYFLEQKKSSRSSKAAYQFDCRMSVYYLNVANATLQFN